MATILRRSHLKKFFGIKDLGEPRFILGMHVTRPSPSHITISQKLHIEKIVKKYNITRTSPHTPATKDDIPSNNDDPDTPPCPQRTKRYRSLLGSLLYTTLTRPDVCVALGNMDRIVNPKPRHQRQLNRIAAYLDGTRDLRLQIKPHDVIEGHELAGWLL